MVKLLRYSIVLLIVALAPTLLQAQAAQGLQRGDEVRVHAPSLRNGRIRGMVMKYEGDLLEVRDATTGEVVPIPITQIERLARSRGIDRGHSTWRAVKIGAFVGGGGGAVSGPLIAATRAPDAFVEVIAASALVGTLAGAGAGAVLGSLFPQEQWQRFRTPITPTLSVTPDGLGFAISAALP